MMKKNIDEIFVKAEKPEQPKAKELNPKKELKGMDPNKSLKGVKRLSELRIKWMEDHPKFQKLFNKKWKH